MTVDIKPPGTKHDYLTVLTDIWCSRKKVVILNAELKTIIQKSSQTFETVPLILYWDKQMQETFCKRVNLYFVKLNKWISALDDGKG